MKKAYLLVPFVALLLFIGLYWNFKSGYEAREQAHKAQIQADKKAKLDAEVEARRQAIDEAVKAQEVRKKEREAKEAAERLKQEARQAALDARDKAFHEQEKITRQIERLKQEISAEKAALAKLEVTRTSQLAEQEFLKTYVRKTEANVKALEDVLRKIDQAEAARLAAAKKAS